MFKMKYFRVAQHFPKLLVTATIAEVFLISQEINQINGYYIVMCHLQYTPLLNIAHELRITLVNLYRLYKYYSRGFYNNRTIISRFN